MVSISRRGKNDHWSVLYNTWVSYPACSFKANQPSVREVLDCAEWVYQIILHSSFYPFREAIWNLDEVVLGKKWLYCTVQKVLVQCHTICSTSCLDNSKPFIKIRFLQTFSFSYWHNTDSDSNISKRRSLCTKPCSGYHNPLATPSPHFPRLTPTLSHLVTPLSPLGMTHHCPGLRSV